MAAIDTLPPLREVIAAHGLSARKSLGQNFLLRGLVSGLAISLPVFFAGIIFAISLSKMKTVELAFGSNLLGSVVGGMLEYSSLIYGIRSLYVLAAFVYVLSLVTLRRRAT